MSIQELADFLDVPVKTIYAWRYHGGGSTRLPGGPPRSLSLVRRGSLARRPDGRRGVVLLIVTGPR
jgi:hypothetical protein